LRFQTTIETTAEPYKKTSRKTMIEYNQSQLASRHDEGISFKVIGVGGAGANVLDRLALEGSDDAQLLVLNTDIRKLSSSVSSQKIQLGAALLKGMGTGGDPDLGRQAAREAQEEIRRAIRGNDMVFVCAGLGGGTGSGSAPEVCRIAREEGVFLVAFLTLPFDFEGARRMQQAKESLEEIENYANTVVTFENDRMGELIVPKDGVTQAFAAADKIISQAIRATMNIVSKPGIIRIGMDDLIAALNSSDSRCLFGYGQAKGDNRALEAVEQTLKCPLLDNGRLLSEARNVLIQVSGSDSMTLLEVQTVMKEITRHLRPTAHVLFGTGTDPRLGSSLAVTVISSLDGKGAAARAADPRPKKQHHLVAPSEREVFEKSTPLAAAVSAAASVSEQADDLPAAEAEPEIDSQAEYEESNIVPMPQFTSRESVHMDANPIATAIQEATASRADQPVDLPGVAYQPSRPLAPQPAAHQPAAHQPAAHEVQPMVEAQTEQAQTIALSRIVPGQTTQRIMSRPPKQEGPVMPVSQRPAEEKQPQKEILQLEPLQSKGRFATTDPTIVDGEDLDIPTFLRKKG